MKSNLRYRLAVLVALLALVLGSCAAGGSSEPPPVPADALGWIQIADPRAALEGLDAFWKAAGIEDATGKSLAETFADGAGKQGGDLYAALREIDASRSIVLALLPPDGADAEPRLVLYLPLRNGRKSLDAINAALPSDSDGEPPALVGSWLVAAIEGSAPTGVPAKRLGLPKSDPKRPEAFLATGLVGPLLDAFAEEISAAVAEVAEAADLLEKTGTLPYDLTALTELFLDALGQLDRVEFSVAFDADGVDFNFGANPAADSELAAFGGRLADGAGALRFLERIPSDALFASAWSINPAVAAEFGKAYLAALDMEDMFGDAYEGYLETWASAAGGYGATSFDMTLAPDLVTRIASAQDPQAIVGILDRGLAMELRAVYDAPNAAAWYAAMALLADDDLYGERFRELMADSGLSFDIRHASDGSGTSRFDTLSFDFKLGSALAAGLDQGTFRLMQGLVDLMARKLALGVAVRDGLGLMSTGGPAAFDALAAGKLAAPASKDPSWKRFLARSPEGLRFAGKFSTRSLARMVVAFKDLTGVELDPADFDGWFFGLSADRTRFGTNVSVPAADIRAFMELYRASGAEPLGT